MCHHIYIITFRFFCHCCGGSTLLTTWLAECHFGGTLLEQSQCLLWSWKMLGIEVPTATRVTLVTIDTYHLSVYIYIIYKTRIGMDEWYYMHQQKPPNLYQCWVLWKLPGGTVLQIRADMRNRLMDLKSRSTPRAFNAIDPKILWFSWCYHSVFLLSEIFWEVLCSGKVMKTLWHQMEYWNVHSLFWGKLLLHRKWQHLVTLIERGQTFGFVMTKKFSDFVTLLYCRLCCSSRKCAGGEHACWSKDSDLNSC